MPAQQQQLGCPNCYTLVPMGTRYGPQCGNAIPPPTWTPVPSASPVPKRNTDLIVVAWFLLPFSSSASQDTHSTRIISNKYFKPPRTQRRMLQTILSTS